MYYILHGGVVGEDGALMGVIYADVLLGLYALLLILLEQDGDTIEEFTTGSEYVTGSI